MKFKYLFTIAINALKSYKARTLLTSIGIVIGISSIIITMSMGNSVQASIFSKIITFGKNSIWLRLNQGGITYNKMTNLDKSIQDIKNYSPLQTSFGIPTQYIKNRHKAHVWGIDNNYFHIKGQEIKSGRELSKYDIISNKKIALISPKVIKNLFKNKNPLGKVILIKNVPFLVIGTLPKRGSSLGSLDYDNIIYIPVSTMINLYKPDKKVDMAIFKAESRLMVPKLKNNLINYFSKKLNVQSKTDYKSYFTVSTSKEQLEIADRISRSMTIFVAAIAAISLIIGGIGVMNIMLVSVTNRTREIGIRLAIGAREGDVLMQFLIESITLSFLGGIIGIIMGIGIYAIIIAALGWKFLLSVPSIFLAFIFTALVGLFFGYYPAKKAASLKPIEALKHE